MRRGRGARGLLSVHLGSGLTGVGRPAVPPGPPPLSLPAAGEAMEVRGPQGLVRGPGPLG